LTSTHNPRVRAALALRERRARDRDGRTLVEGHDELLLALESGAALGDLFYCPALFSVPDPDTLLGRAAAAGARLVEVDRRVFDRLAYREHPDGFLAVAAIPRRSLAELSLGKNPLIVIVEALEKPGNLGAILRTADAAGVDALIACDSLTDWGNPNVVRASKGTVFSVQTAEASTAKTIDWLREHGISILAATPSATRLYYDMDLCEPVALVVGAERQGLSAAWLARQEEWALVPMQGRANSLNVATVAALLMYEAVRQRRE
jgi:TrmH family RNA methyltransferase